MVTKNDHGDEPSVASDPWSDFLGEVLGTFLMCFLGIGAVATATLYESHTGPYQIGMIWGLAIMIGIYMTRNLSAAHFNPAVTFAMCLSGRCAWKNFPIYVAGQFVGAILGSGTLWLFFMDTIKEQLAGIANGMAEATQASSIWLEVFPNTPNGIVSLWTAGFAEALGVSVLVLVIFSMTEGCNLGRPSFDLFPVFIGLTIAGLISTIGPMTNAGLNPARDLGPRLVGYLAGFRAPNFTLANLFVYTLCPLIGAAMGVLVFRYIVEPRQNFKNTCCC